MKSIAQVYEALEKGAPKKVALAAAAFAEGLQSVRMAKDKGIATAILVGDEAEIRAAAQKGGVDISDFEMHHVAEPSEVAMAAVELVRSGQADIIMKGMLDSGEFLRAVLHKENGLRKPDTVLSTIAVVELKTLGRLVFLTDPGITTAPDLKTKAAMIRNAVDVAQRFGIEHPKVAALCASETVSEKIPATVEAAKLAEMNRNGEISGCVVAGPISLDLALSPHAAEEKGYVHPVAGKADVLLAPDIEAANILYKSLALFAGIETGGVLSGTTHPVIFTSRADTAETKLNTVAFAAYLAKEAQP